MQFIWWIPLTTWTLIALSVFVKPIRYRTIYTLKKIAKTIKNICLGSGKFIAQMIASSLFTFLILAVVVMIALNFIRSTATDQPMLQISLGGGFISGLIAYTIDLIAITVKSILQFALWGAFKTIRLLLFGLI